MSMSSYVDDDRVAYICNISIKRENQNWKSEFLRMQAELHSTLNESKRHLTSQLFEMVYQRLSQAIADLFRILCTEQQAPRRRGVEQDAPHTNRNATHNTPRGSAQSIGGAQVDLSHLSIEEHKHHE